MAVGNALSLSIVCNVWTARESVGCLDALAPVGRDVLSMCWSAMVEYAYGKIGSDGADSFVFVTLS